MVQNSKLKKKPTQKNSTEIFHVISFCFSYVLSCSQKGVCLLGRSRRRVSEFWRTCLVGILVLYWWPLGV